MTKLENLYFVLNSIDTIKSNVDCKITAIKNVCAKFKSIKIKESSDKLIITFNKNTFFIRYGLIVIKIEREM